MQRFPCNETHPPIHPVLSCSMFFFWPEHWTFVLFLGFSMCAWTWTTCTNVSTIFCLICVEAKATCFEKYRSWGQETWASHQGLLPDAWSKFSNSVWTHAGGARGNNVLFIHQLIRVLALIAITAFPRPISIGWARGSVLSHLSRCQCGRQYKSILIHGCGEQSRLGPVRPHTYTESSCPQDSNW